MFQRNLGHKVDCTYFSPRPCPKRYTTYSEMLKPMEYQSNLDIVILTTATRIEFLPNSQQAKRVHYVKDGESHIALLKDGGSVIVTAGPIITPKILLQSGIGDCNHLQDFDIECIVDSPQVGQGYKDHHVLSFFSLLFGAPDSSIPVMSGYLKSPGSDRIDTEIAFVVAPTGLGIPLMLTQIISLRQETSGYIKMRYKDPLAEPDYAHNFDVSGSGGDKFRYYIDLVRQWHKNLPFFVIDIDPSSQLSDPPTTSELQSLVDPYWHSTSGARMGVVLDDYGKIIGADNIYVMDSSATPIPAGTHPSTTITAMALKMVGQLRPDNAKC